MIKYPSIDKLLRDVVNEYIIFDCDTLNIIKMNQTATEELGYDPDDIKNSDILTLLPDLKRESLLELLENENGDQVIITTQISRIDDSHYPVELNVYRGEYESRSVYLALINDITEQQWAEEAISWLRHKSDSILKAAGEGIIGLDEQGRHTFVNPAASKMLGYSEDELLGRTAHILWHHTRKDGEPYPIEEDKIYQTYSNGIVHRNNDAVFWHKDGSPIPVDYISTPIFEDEKIVGAVLTFSDISERKRMQQYLHQAQKMDAISHLASGVAHEINNVLSSLIGIAELGLENHSDPFLIESNYKAIIEKCDGTANMVRQLFAFSKEQDTELAAIDINSIIKNTSNVLERVIGEDIQLSITLNDGKKLIMADSMSVEQMLTNLCINARDAMPEGGKLGVKTDYIILDEAYCEMHPGVSPGEYQALIVTDTGTGICDEDKLNIFDPFFTTKTKANASGLGLSIVYGMVQQHNGHIECKSELGQGTSFTLYFPVIQDPLQDPKTKSKTELMGNKEKIMIVEDDDDLLLIISSIMEQYNYKIITARNGKEGYQVFKENHDSIDLVLTDIVMPEMGGIEMYERITTENPDIKFVFMTGYSPDIAYKRYSDNSNLEIIQKPFRRFVLADLVKQLLEQ